MSAMELRNFESQLELLSFAEQLSIMECLARIMQRSQNARQAASQASCKKRQFGSAKGKFIYPQNFDEDNEEIAYLFGAV